MNLQKFTERSREFIQEAQSAALAAEHQRILPQHLLKVILEDEQDFFLQNWLRFMSSFSQNFASIPIKFLTLMKHRVQGT